MNKHKFRYKWNLFDGYPAPNIESHGLKVFGTFICGGGSTMGYKLAGYNHIGGVEIDPQVADIYKTNHAPKYLYVEDIRDFADRHEFPDDLYNLDILDGSPPCSSFSMAGNREKDWGKTKVFREGQSEQRLDDLFFDYIKLAKKLQPKVVIAENVKGLIQGNAKNYVHRIKKKFEEAGYKVQLFLLNAASMGVPQKRERVFFICQRNDLNFPLLRLCFNEELIPYKLIEDFKDTKGQINKDTRTYLGWKMSKQGQTFAEGINDGGSMFGYTKVNRNDVIKTVVSNGGTYEWHDIYFRKLNKNEYKLAGSFPLDYNFKNIEPKYLIGMSVPPVMTAQIAHEIYLQWFKK